MRGVTVMKLFFRGVMAALLCLCFFCSVLCLPAAAEPSVSAACAVVMDADSGQIVWAKNADTRHAMASTTKIMTALVALRSAELDRSLEVSPEAAGIEGSSVYLYPGEKLTLEELLYAMLLESANDAAAAVAIALSGSVEAFANEMNVCAAELGLTDTHFTNPHGLWDEDHYTTAAELAHIARAAMTYPAFRTMVSTYRKTIPLNQTEGVRLLINHNKLLKLSSDVIGVKTGYTRKSGRCLVSAAERNGVTLIAVTLDAPDDWRDHLQMLDYGFSRLTHYSFGAAGELCYTLPVVGGEPGYLTVFNTAPLAVTLDADAPPPKLRIELPHMLYAPVEADTALGQICCISEGKVVAQVPLAAAFSVERIPTKEGFWTRLGRFLGIC